jgi:hypothetical protein
VIKFDLMLRGKTAGENKRQLATEDTETTEGNNYEF